MSFLRPVLRSLTRTRVAHVPFRPCLTYNNGGAYEGDGKTSLIVLNRDVNDRILIDSYSTHGFRLNSGLFVCGPAAFFPRTLLSWDVEGPWDLSIESMALFWLIEPKPDLLIIGVGDAGNTVPDDVRIFLNQKKISLEILETGAACAAFNFMNADHRNVAAALIPRQTMILESDGQIWDNLQIKGKLHHMSTSTDDMIDAQERRKHLEFEEILAKIADDKFEPLNEVRQRDLKEMVEKGMISAKEAKRYYPGLKLGPGPSAPQKIEDTSPAKTRDQSVDESKDKKE